MKKILPALLLIIGFYPAITVAQDTSPPCSTAAHHQFDFWLGDWEVFGPADTIVGYNRVIGMLNGCVIQENWQSKGPYTGTSYNYYDSVVGIISKIFNARCW